VTKLTNAERLRLKESDRIDSITGCLNDLGFTAEGRPDEIIIYGDGGKDREAVQNTLTAETAGDHRIVMMAAVLSLITPTLSPQLR
jgi:3-phosphoshikimate 1-carboxyvinyltransferase